MRGNEVVKRGALGLASYGVWLQESSWAVRAGISLLMGALSVLAFAPYSFPFVFLLTLPSLVWALDGVAEPGRRASGRFWGPFGQAFLIGWAFGTGFFLAGLNWVAEAFFVDAELFGWMAPFAVLFLSAGLALFAGGAAALARLFWVPGYGRVAVLAVSWVAFEWLRGHVLTGFPWNTLGQAAAASDALMQGAALMGTYALGFVIFLAAAVPAAFDPRYEETGNATFFETWRLPLGAVAALALLWAGGAARLWTAEAGLVEDVKLRIVQPNIPQSQKWLTENRNTIVGQYLRLSESAPDEYTHLIWPESALPYIVEREPILRAALGRMLEPGRFLIMGAVRTEAAPGAAGNSGLRDLFFNAVHVVNDKGAVTATYDKAHLVPFGEYLPLQSLLEAVGLRQLTRLRGGYESGPGRMTLPVPGAPDVSPLVCYEIIFPADVVKAGEERPGWMVNLTNDAWFGTSSGPYQHLAQARLRAVEEGMPVVRAANTGISAVIDAHGRLIASLPLLTEGVLDAALPEALAPPFYARFGDWILLLMLFGALTLVLGRRARTLQYE